MEVFILWLRTLKKTNITFRSWFFYEVIPLVISWATNLKLEIVANPLKVRRNSKRYGKKIIELMRSHKLVKGLPIQRHNQLSTSDGGG